MKYLDFLDTLIMCVAHYGGPAICGRDDRATWEHNLRDILGDAELAAEFSAELRKELMKHNRYSLVYGSAVANEKGLIRKIVLEGLGSLTNVQLGCLATDPDLIGDVATVISRNCQSEQLAAEWRPQSAVQLPGGDILISESRLTHSIMTLAKKFNVRAGDTVILADKAPQKMAPRGEASQKKAHRDSHPHTVVVNGQLVSSVTDGRTDNATSNGVDSGASAPLVVVGDVATQFRASRAETIEAVRALLGDGPLEWLSLTAGVTLPPLSGATDELTELARDFGGRFWIELIACCKFPRDRIDELKQLVQQASQIARDPDADDRFKALDRELHARIVRYTFPSCEASVVTAFRRINDRLPTYSDIERRVEMCQEHSALIKAIETGSPRRIAEQINLHFYGAARRSNRDLPARFAIPDGLPEAIASLCAVEASDAIRKAFDDLQANDVFGFASQDCLAHEWEKDDPKLIASIAGAVNRAAYLVYGTAKTEEHERRFREFFARIVKATDLPRETVARHVVHVDLARKNSLMMVPGFTYGIFCYREDSRPWLFTFRAPDDDRQAGQIRVGAATESLHAVRNLLEKSLWARLDSGHNEAALAIRRVKPGSVVASHA